MKFEKDVEEKESILLKKLSNNIRLNFSLITFILIILSFTIIRTTTENLQNIQELKQTIMRHDSLIQDMREHGLMIEPIENPYFPESK